MQGRTSIIAAISFNVLTFGCTTQLLEMPVNDVPRSIELARGLYQADLNEIEISSTYLEVSEEEIGQAYGFSGPGHISVEPIVALLHAPTEVSRAGDVFGVLIFVNIEVTSSVTSEAIYLGYFIGEFVDYVPLGRYDSEVTAIPLQFGNVVTTDEGFSGYAEAQHPACCDFTYNVYEAEISPYVGGVTVSVHIESAGGLTGSGNGSSASIRGNFVLVSASDSNVAFRCRDPENFGSDCAITNE